MRDDSTCEHKQTLEHSSDILVTKTKSIQFR